MLIFLYALGMRPGPSILPLGMKGWINSGILTEQYELHPRKLYR
jgi:hypothetical protein